MTLSWGLFIEILLSVKESTEESLLVFIFMTDLMPVHSFLILVLLNWKKIIKICLSTYPNITNNFVSEYFKQNFKLLLEFLLLSIWEWNLSPYFIFVIKSIVIQGWTRCSGFAHPKAVGHFCQCSQEEEHTVECFLWGLNLSASN